MGEASDGVEQLLQEANRLADEPSWAQRSWKVVTTGGAAAGLVSTMATMFGVAPGLVPIGIGGAFAAISGLAVVSQLKWVRQLRTMLRAERRFRKAQRWADAAQIALARQKHLDRLPLTKRWQATALARALEDALRSGDSSLVRQVRSARSRGQFGQRSHAQSGFALSAKDQPEREIATGARVDPERTEAIFERVRRERERAVRPIGSSLERSLALASR